MVEPVYDLHLAALAAREEIAGLAHLDPARGQTEMRALAEHAFQPAPCLDVGVARLAPVARVRNDVPPKTVLAEAEMNWLVLVVQLRPGGLGQHLRVDILFGPGPFVVPIRVLKDRRECLGEPPRHGLVERVRRRDEASDPLPTLAIQFLCQTVPVALGKVPDPLTRVTSVEHDYDALCPGSREHTAQLARWYRLEAAEFAWRGGVPAHEIMLIPSRRTVPKPMEEQSGPFRDSI